MTLWPGQLNRKFTLPRPLTLVLIAFALLGSSCAPNRGVKRYLNKNIGEKSGLNHYNGLYIVDAENGNVVFNRYGSQAFTPASVTKVFTLYTALKLLPERVPALQYAIRGDSIFISGTGDPAALHPDLKDSTAFHFLSQFSYITEVKRPFNETVWGPGWSWEDFDQYYSPDRSSLPIHGNIVRFQHLEDTLLIDPLSFADSLDLHKGPFARDFNGNTFYQIPNVGDTLDVPIKTNPELERFLWAAALGKNVYKGNWPDGISIQTLPGMSRDSICRQMMTVSDNFLAEQLMLLASSKLGDTLGFKIARDYMLNTALQNIPQKPKWVDGSGLSRYNLMTPESIVWLLRKMLQEFPQKQLFELMAQSGKNGTLKNLDSGTDSPYLFGKSGSMGGIQNVCGYLKTKSGKILVFAYMNNHFTGPGTPVKTNMHETLRWIHKTF